MTLSGRDMPAAPTAADTLREVAKVMVATGYGEAAIRHLCAELDNTDNEEDGK